MARSNVVKRADKLLAECKAPLVWSGFLKGALDKLVKVICNAALNVEQGDSHFEGP